MPEQPPLFEGMPDRVIPYSKGYADRPGTGPEGETCGSCKHFVRQEFAKTYFKCGLIKWTHGAATDIRARTPACSKWRSPLDE